MAIMNGSISSAGTEVEKLNLYDIPCLQLDENDNWLRPEYPRYKMDLAPAKAFLVPSFDNEIVEILPSAKQNRKINFDESVYVMDIENRFQMMLEEEQIEQDDEVSYEIEIVEGGQTDDADFYLEMIDGEIFYVFETEDDISVEDDGGDDEEMDDASDDSSSTEDQSAAVAPLQFDIGNLMAPNLNESNRSLTDGQPAYISDDEDNSDTGNNNNNDSSSSDDDSSSTNDQRAVLIPAQLQIDQMILDTEGKQIDAVTEATSAESTIASTPLISSIERDNLSGEVMLKEENVESTADGDPPVPTDSVNDSLVVDIVPSSPQQQQRPTLTRTDSSGESMRSILKSPKIESPKRIKKEKKSPKESKIAKSSNKKKTFSKTYVRADDFDGEHRVYNWEKPSWAKNNSLRCTGKGDAILKGANLAQPITDTKKILESGKVKWEKPDWASLDGEGDGENDDNDSAKTEKTSGAGEDINAKEELIRKIQEGGLNLPSSRKGGSRLKITLNGSSLRHGSDIVKPITKATVIKKPSNVNTIANPKILRATPIGSQVRQGQALEAPTTQATQLKKYTFERPTWTQGKLRSTYAGDVLKKGGDFALAITPATAEQNRYQKEEWKAKRGIGRQASASIAEEYKRREYGWEKPSWAVERNLRKTRQGDAVRAGVGLSRPITSLPHLKTVTTSENKDEGNVDEESGNRIDFKEKQQSLQRECGGLGDEEPFDDGGSVTDLQSLSYKKPSRNLRAGSEPIRDDFESLSPLRSLVEDDDDLSPRQRLIGDPIVTRSRSMD